MKKYFPEIYENQTSLNKLSTKLIDNPYKPGSKISVKNLIKTIQIKIKKLVFAFSMHVTSNHKKVKKYNRI